MLTSLKLFVRSIKRNKLFSLINILGLTVGFFSSVLIYLYVQGEMSYDQFHENGDRIYRVNQTFIWGEDNPNLFSATGPGVGASIREDIPEVKHVVRVHTAHEMLPIIFQEDQQEKFFKDETVFAVDSNFFQVFTYPLLHGDPTTCLDNPGAVVLTFETAERFFGSQDVVGRELSMDNGELFQVTGVMKPIDDNSYLGNMDVLVSLSSIERMKTTDWNWIWTMFETYILLEEQADPVAVQSKLDELPRLHAGRTLEIMGYTYEEYIAAGKEWNLYMQAFPDIYLSSNGIYTILNGVGDAKIVAALIGSAIFLIILSCINFINLSTAQFTTRAQDVAVRKIMGGSSRNSMWRFFGDAFFYCFAAAALALVGIVYAVPLINQSLGTQFALTSAELFQVVTFMLLLIVLVSAVSGFYPFLFFNAFKPVSAMKGELRTGRKGIRLRNGMLVAQYVLSFLLIIGTITIYQQLDHFMKADIGFEKANIITIENADWTSSIEDFANELSAIDGVVGTSVCDAVPMLISNGDQFTPDEPEAGAIPLSYALADENYVELLDFELVIGRSFDASYANDTASVLLNETAARTIGWDIDASILNKQIENWSGKYRVIGVLRDFNFWSLHTPIEPFGIFHKDATPHGGKPLSRVMVKAQGTAAGLEALKKRLERKWVEFAPNRPFEYTVLSEHFEESYQTEERFGSVMAFFAVLTIIIASLGLFGIVVFTLEQKLKEIGVRKVLGASVASIVLLFSKSYVKLLLLAFIITVPLGYYMMDTWLSDFEYRIQLGVDVFAIALFILLFISLSISVIQSVKASLMNPAEVLKDE